MMTKNKALLIVDLQNDFCPGGALAVRDGDKVVDVLNKYIKIFERSDLPILASRDWHPAKTTHFKDYGGVWPQHCVQNTPGAAFHPDLTLSPDAVIITKGADPQKDSYSAFLGTTDQGQDLNAFLRSKGVRQLFIGGLATDYCVMSSCLDARTKGSDVYLLVDAVKGVNLKPDDSPKAIDKMHSQGVQDTDLNCIEKVLVGS